MTITLVGSGVIIGRGRDIDGKQGNCSKIEQVDLPRGVTDANNQFIDACMHRLYRYV
jgi:hypothetical protein